jgi:hypothetical protein
MLKRVALDGTDCLGDQNQGIDTAKEQPKRKESEMSNANRYVGGIALMLVGAIWGFIGGMRVGVRSAHDEMRKEAIKHHAAEWQADSETGEVKFVWKTKE